MKHLPYSLLHITCTTVLSTIVICNITQWITNTLTDFMPINNTPEIYEGCPLSIQIHNPIKCRRETKNTGCKNTILTCHAVVWTVTSPHNLHSTQCTSSNNQQVDSFQQRWCKSNDRQLLTDHAHTHCGATKAILQRTENMEIISPCLQDELIC